MFSSKPSGEMSIVVVVLLLLQQRLSVADHECASCSGMADQQSCQHNITCAEYEKCFVLHYETESGVNLYDMGCMTSTECPHTLSSIVGKRGEGHHVMCGACCNNAVLCNKELSCESIQNQGSSYPRDCSELNLRERINDTYTIYPYGVSHKAVMVYCIFDYADVAWTVIQHRMDGSVDFYRDWADYASGFGTTHGEYWLGLENIHALTTVPNYELKVLMSDFQNVTKHATYASFHCADASENYRLAVHGYTGTAGDAMTRHDGMMFSTYDKDHDTVGSNCAIVYHGAWWYTNCHDSNLNGKYVHGQHSSYADGIEWRPWHGYYYSLRATTMMIRKT